MGPWKLFRIHLFKWELWRTQNLRLKGLQESKACLENYKEMCCAAADFGINISSPSCSELYSPGWVISSRSSPRTINTAAEARNSLQQEVTYFTTSDCTSINKASDVENSSTVLQGKGSAIMITDFFSPKCHRTVLQYSRSYSGVLI